tara:strand:+ start:3622 stop:4440 length:819 start_codon:yes stop_codon:yes gene_type:complete
MPRTTYHDRFAALLAKDYVAPRDRKFAEDLYSHYKTKGSMTSGRRRCFLQMEERYATRPEPLDGADELGELLKRIQRTVQGSTRPSWDHGFVSSVQGQLRSGRALSERQAAILTDIKDKFSDEKIATQRAWMDSWNAEKAESYRVVMEYYGNSGYFTRQVNAWREDRDITPSYDDYCKVTDNKFAKKILDGWHAPPKYAPGSMVALGSGASYRQREQCPNRYNLCMVIASNVAVPSSAARGNKVYRVLPVGAAKPFIVEERQLKASRLPKKK